MGANESLFREVNERLAGLADERGRTSLEIVCECDREDCTERISLSIQEYEEVRQNAKAFIVLRGHADPDYESVLASSGAHDVVEKFGEAGEVARVANPRNGKGPE
jgi:hypothetical protein